MDITMKVRKDRDRQQLKNMIAIRNRILYPRIDFKRLTEALGWCIVVLIFISGF